MHKRLLLGIPPLPLWKSFRLTQLFQPFIIGATSGMRCRGTPYGNGLFQRNARQFNFLAVPATFVLCIALRTGKQHRSGEKHHFCPGGVIPLPVHRFFHHLIPHRHPARCRIPYKFFCRQLCRNAKSDPRGAASRKSAPQISVSIPPRSKNVCSQGHFCEAVHGAERQRRREAPPPANLHRRFLRPFYHEAKMFARKDIFARPSRAQSANGAGRRCLPQICTADFCVHYNTSARICQSCRVFSAGRPSRACRTDANAAATGGRGRRAYSSTG